ncbi:DNA-directed RNA polymerase subunit beta [Solibacillus sp. CAU 1738]|uniref:DNA-directed RNA polymerase subunit beta n=1 Tax=Solibacillus sp. CAU 1738 TaxID=3140363 RepID=UPI00326110D1
MTNELKEQREVEPKKRRSKKQNAAEQLVETKGTRWVQIRLIPIWIRILLVLILIIVAAIAGVIIGYGYIGSGEPADALKWSTWQHILDIIEGKE